MSARTHLARALVLMALLASVACASVPEDSGITGEVRIGPVNPVETPGAPSSAPYSAELVIRPEGGGGKTVRVTSGEDGRFRVNLSPGTYVIEPKQGDPLPTAQSVTVEVKPHEFASVVIDYDSGIR